MSSHFSDLELSRVTDCPVVAWTSDRVDPRFKNIDQADRFKIDEWRIYESNGVAEILKSMHEKYPEISAEPSLKSENKLGLYVRNTVPWSLECEVLHGMDRQFGFQQFSVEMEVATETQVSIDKLSLASIVVVCVLTFCGLCGSLVILAWRTEKAVLVWIILFI